MTDRIIYLIFQDDFEEDFGFDMDDDLTSADFDPNYSYETWNTTILGKWLQQIVKQEN